MLWRGWSVSGQYAASEGDDSDRRRLGTTYAHARFSDEYIGDHSGSYGAVTTRFSAAGRESPSRVRAAAGGGHAEDAQLVGCPGYASPIGTRVLRRPHDAILDAAEESQEAVENREGVWRTSGDEEVDG